MTQNEVACRGNCGHRRKLRTIQTISLERYHREMLDLNSELLLDMYDRMKEAFGHRNWWPADSPFEVCVGAILTQNTSWKNVAKAIVNLKEIGALDPFVLYGSSETELSSWIKPAGYFNVKAGRLKNFVRHLVERHGGSLNSMFSSEMES
jgi:endonuclease-3 related protein